MPKHGGGGYGYHGMHGHYYGHGHYGHPWFRHRFGRGGPGSMFPDPQVSTAQACLAQVVDPSVPQNGIMGPQTRQAIRTFQTQQQMPATGTLDSDTMSALQAACSPQQAAPPPPPPPPPQVQVSAPPPGSKHSQGQGQGQQEAFLGDFLNPLGPLGGVIGGLFQGGGSQPQPPQPPDDSGDPWRRRHHRFGRGHHETENEFPFERPFFDFHRPDRFPEGRWGRDHDPRYWWDHDREGEVRAEPLIQADHVRSVGQAGVARSVIERPIIERPIIERPIIERPVIERPVSARAAFARPGFDFHVHDRLPFARGRWNWNRDRFRWFGRPWGRRDWGFGFPGGGPQVAWAQSCLAQVLGSWVVQDGIMGPATQGAIRTFQEQQQLPVTGVLDGPTMNALQAACRSQMPSP
jgi:peptidoglycan hydrolase-like protein with peptidoglycan-binding domain